MTYMNIALIAVTGFILTAILTKGLIPVLQRKQAGQNIREEGPKAHLSKAGTPSMGGIAIVIGGILAGLVGGHYTADTAVAFLGLLLFGAMGFLDDYLKVVKKQNEGLKSGQKFFLQLIVAIGFALYMAFISESGTMVYIPIADINVDFGMAYIPFIVFVIVAMANGVNLTDGLDGLASGTTAIVGLFMALIAVGVGNNGATSFFSALLGACLGFLLFNRHPAKIFMGDTGSLAMGGGIAMAAIVMKVELLLPLVGLIYVLEALSVIIQVGVFKATGGKRVFKMAPLHHHFELSGLHETKVALLFWAITLVCCAIGLAIM